MNGLMGRGVVSASTHSEDLIQFLTSIQTVVDIPLFSHDVILLRVIAGIFGLLELLPELFHQSPQTSVSDVLLFRHYIFSLSGMHAHSRQEGKNGVAQTCTRLA